VVCVAARGAFGLDLVGSLVGWDEVQIMPSRWVSSSLGFFLAASPAKLLRVMFSSSPAPRKFATETTAQKPVASGSNTGNRMKWIFV
jgi:hypothetical protein